LEEKATKNFSEHNAKNFRLKMSYRYREIIKNKNVSLTYDVNDHVYADQNPSNFVRI